MAPPIVFTAMLIFMCLTQGYTSDHKECKTSQCKKTAERMEALMNRSADPCQDFSQFACGQFYTDAVIPPTKDGVGNTFEHQKEKIYKFYKKKLEEPIISRPGRHSYERKMKTYYMACLDTESMEVHGLTDYKDSYRLEWPTLNQDWLASSFSLETLVANDVKSYTFSFFGIWHAVDYSNPKKPYLIPQISTPPFRLSRDVAKNSLALERYYRDVAVALGADKNTAECDAKDVVVFMRNLSKIYPGYENFTTYTLQELSTKDTSLNWVKIFQDIYDNLDVKMHPSQNISTDMFVENLGGVLAKTDKMTIQNFLGFKRALKVVGEATKKMRNIKYEFDQRKQKPRDLYCLDKTVYIYYEGLAKLASDAIYPKESQERLQAVATKVKNAFKDSLQNTTLLSQTDRREALLKVQELDVKIGVQSEHFEDEDVDRVYKDCVVSEDNFNTDYLQNDNTLWADHLKISTLPYKPYLWKYFMTGYRSIIAPERHGIVIQLGVLQPPRFEKNNPSYLNYGTIAALVGDLIHMTITQFGHSIEQRQLQRYNDWNSQTAATYSERAKCFGKQYSNFTLKDWDVKIEDEATEKYDGITHAYKAYKTHTPENDLPLPGLSLTNDQLFFLANAQVQCVQYTPEVAKQNLAEGRVSPALRINGLFQNMEGFSTAFNCKAGAAMNPAHKCSLW